MESDWIREVSFQFFVSNTERELEKIPIVNKRYPTIPSAELLEGKSEFVDLSKVYYDLRSAGWNVVCAERRTRANNWHHSVVFFFERFGSARIDRRIRDRPGVVHEAFVSFIKSGLWFVRVYQGEREGEGTVRFVVKPQRRHQQDQEPCMQLLRVLDHQIQYQTQPCASDCDSSLDRAA